MDSSGTSGRAEHAVISSYINLFLFFLDLVPRTLGLPQILCGEKDDPEVLILLPQPPGC